MGLFSKKKISKEVNELENESKKGSKAPKSTTESMCITLQPREPTCITEFIQL